MAKTEEGVEATTAVVREVENGVAVGEAVEEEEEDVVASEEAIISRTKKPSEWWRSEWVA